MIEYLKLFYNHYHSTVFFILFIFVFIYLFDKFSREGNQEKIEKTKQILIIYFFALAFFAFGDARDALKVMDGEKEIEVVFIGSQEYYANNKRTSITDHLYFINENEVQFEFEDKRWLWKEKYSHLEIGETYKVTYFDFHLIKSIEPTEENKKLPSSS